MNKKNLMIGLGLAAGLAVGAASGYRWWRSAVLHRSSTTTLKEAVTAFEQGRPAESLAKLDRARPSAVKGADWQDLEIRSAAAARKLDRLMAIYERQPERIAANEEASFLVYRALIAAGKTAAAETLAAPWRAKPGHPALWVLHQADGLIGNRKGAEARKLLSAVEGWAPADEAQRLLRLAILTAPEDMTAAWRHLEKGSELDPKNADLRSFRGQILEAAGRFQEARVEYVAAHVAEPANPLRRDQLGEFYTRQGSFDLAVPTWLEAGSSGTGFMEVKGRFWARVVQPALAATPAPEFSGVWRNALDAIDLAPPGRWTAPLSGSTAPALLQHGELWWLALLDHLQSGGESAATTTLATVPAKAEAMAPDLVAALRTVLALRAKRPLDNILWPALSRGRSRPSFFTRLEALTRDARSQGQLPADDPTVALARHPGSLAYVFATAGWREAGLRLHAWEASEAAPQAMLYTIARCFRLNRGPDAAASFLTNRQGPLLRGLHGECLIASGKVKEGLETLTEAAGDDSDAGRRAGWLLTSAKLEQRDFTGAESTLAGSPGLAASPEGLDLAAKLALARSQPTEATALYRRSAAAGSPEAQTWLLREAVKSGDAVAAREASITLRQLLPDELQTRSNQLILPAQ